MIRPATYTDIEAMLSLGAAMHGESRYAALPWSTPKVGHLIVQLIDSPDGLALVAEQGGAVVGGFLGTVYEHFFSTARVACDFALFVRPDRRGGRAAAALLKAYAAWAKERGAVLIQAGITTGVNVEASARLYERLGFAPAGHLFEFKGA